MLICIMNLEEGEIIVSELNNSLLVRPEFL